MSLGPFVSWPGAKYLEMAVESLALNKVRSALTMLGIVVGVFAVIVMIGLGQASQAYVTNQVQGLGAGLLIVMPGSPDQGALAGSLFATPSLTLSDARALEKLPGVAFTAPASVVRTLLEAGRHAVGAEVVGTVPAIEKIQDIHVERGRFFTEREATAAARVAMIGSKVADELFTHVLADPVGAKITLQGQRFTVVGVLESGDGLKSMDEKAIIPLRTFQAVVRGDDFINVIYVRVTDEQLMPRMQAQLRDVLRQRHGLRATAKDDFSIQTQADLLETMNAVTRGFTVLLTGIAAISLVVGGIGIMNIMLVAVSERTREIGLRKAVGAKRRDILAQFLFEAATISLLGGGVGIALGLALTWGLTRLAHLPFVISPAAVGGGVLFSAAVGVFFGLYPADRASRLQPVDAFRNE